MVPLVQLFTIGYEGRRVSELAATLRAHRIDVVLDVREVAWSRKRGFSKGQLSLHLASEGIAYYHDPRLGSPRELRKSYRATGDWDAFIAGFRSHLKAQESALRQHAEAMAGDRVCLLCFEAQPAECHRSAVADAFASLASATATHL